MKNRTHAHPVPMDMRCSSEKNYCDPIGWLSLSCLQLKQILY